MEKLKILRAVKILFEKRPVYHHFKKVHHSKICYFNGHLQGPPEQGLHDVFSLSLLFSFVTERSLLMDLSLLLQRYVRKSRKKIFHAF